MTTWREKFNELKSQVDPEQAEYWLEDFSILREFLETEVFVLTQLTDTYKKQVEQWSRYLDSMPPVEEVEPSSATRYAVLSVQHYRLLWDTASDQLIECTWILALTNEEIERMKS